MAVLAGYMLTEMSICDLLFLDSELNLVVTNIEGIIRELLNGLVKKEETL